MSNLQSAFVSSKNLNHDPTIIADAIADSKNPALTNQVIIQTIGPNGMVEVSTYLEDQYMFESALLCLLSVMSFYPTIYFLQAQSNRRVGLRMFD